MSWYGSRVAGQLQANVRAEMEALARDLEAYLRATLHRDTGELAEGAFATVEAKATTILIRAGSTAEHAFWHEVRYHPQLRESLDKFAPTLAAAVRAAMRRTA